MITAARALGPICDRAWAIGIASRGAKVTVVERVTSIGELTRFLNRLVHCTGALADREFR
jgi:hypothetical protein